MSMQLTKVIDPRDNLARATRDELWDYAKANGVDFDQSTATKALMEQVLRGRGLVNIRVAVRQQGRPTGQYFGAPGGDIAEPEIRTVSVEDDIVRQYEEAQKNSQRIKNDTLAKRAEFRSEMELALVEKAGGSTWNEMRWEAKRRGIKLDRRDNMDTLKEKLRVTHAA